MSRIVFPMKQGNRLPSLRAGLTDPPPSPGAPPPAANLTAATGVMFRMRQVGPAPSAFGPVKVNAAAVIEDAPNGIIRYDWGASDTDTTGVFEGEFEVTFLGGKKLSYPSDENFLVRIVGGVS